jgi:hypothetical protein
VLDILHVRATGPSVRPSRLSVSTVPAVRRFHQILLIASLVPASWLGMQAVHELGHVVGAWLTGGQVTRVVLDPRTISRTDLSDNPCPLIVVWAGPILGCVLPLAAWSLIAACRWPWAYLLRFFAGFCLVANGAYIAVGSFGQVGDAGVMLRLGSPAWCLWTFGALTVPAGFALWHGQSGHFGLGNSGKNVHPAAAYTCLGVLVVFIVLGLIVDGE